MRRWIALCTFLLLLAALTACAQTDTKQNPKTESPPPKEVVEPHGSDDTVTVSTAAELIRVIAPDAHIILKPGDYNFSALTEEEIGSCGGYVRPDSLAYGEIAIYNAPGLTLEAEESGSVRLITENGYADVMTLTLCDGVVLKGLILGHEIKKGECDANVLELSTSQSVTLEDCGLFGCGTYGIWAENAAGLTVTGTEIYECTNGIFCLSNTTETVFDRCQFYDNDGMFFLWEETEVLVRDTEIFQNRNPLLEGYPEDVRITFRDCIFRDNPDMGAPEDWFCASFENCELPAAPSPVSAKTAYDELIQRYRQIVADPYGSSAETAGERCVLTAARDMREWDEKPVETLGYAVEGLSGDGVPELAIGPMREYGVYLFTLFTLVDGKPQLVFGEKGDGSYAYLQDGSFFYYGYRSASETGQGFYRLTDDGTALICEEFYFVKILDGDESDVTVYYNTTGSWDIEDSQETDMPLEWFWAWEPEYENLSMIPFSATD